MTTWKQRHDQCLSLIIVFTYTEDDSVFLIQHLKNQRHLTRIHKAKLILYACS